MPADCSDASVADSVCWVAIYSGDWDCSSACAAGPAKPQDKATAAETNAVMILRFIFLYAPFVVAHRRRGLPDRDPETPYRTTLSKNNVGYAVIVRA